jgi:hypothetical protein
MQNGLAWFRLLQLSSLSLALGSALPAQQPPTAPLDARVYPCADTAAATLPALGDSAANRQAEYRAFNDWILARRYAPILRFAPGERYFPTVPFFTAFDTANYTIVRMSDRAASGASGDTIPERYAQQPLKPSERPLPSFSFVRDQYLQRVDAELSPHQLPLPQPAVFYRVCDLVNPGQVTADSADWRGPADAVWRYLRSDEQSWDRFGLDTVSAVTDTANSPVLIRDVVQFRVIQYFFYYLGDWGLQGHAHDIEYAFVFVPRDTTIAKRFRILVGAGHDPPAPNNVLVLLGSEAGKLKHLNQNILVELGGHSSAPDMPPFGQFSAGLDVNWHIDDVWGTRDEQATGGISFAGRYEGTMTYPRDPEDAVTLFPKPLEALDSSTHAMLRGLVRISPDYLASRVATAAKPSSQAPRGRLSLADSVIAAYQGVERRQESFVLRWLDYMSARKAQRAQADTLSRKEQLQDIDRQRRADLVRAIDTVLQASGVSRHAALAAQLKNFLDLERQRLPLDSLRVGIAELIPPADSTAEDRNQISNEIRNVVDERLLPRYSLVPAEYMQQITAGAIANDRERVRRYLLLVTRFLFPVTCSDQPCRAPDWQGETFDTSFQHTVCGTDDASEGSQNGGRVTWPRSLACQFDTLPAAKIDSLLELMALWDGDLWDAHWPDPKGSERLQAYRHKIWQRPSYRDPGAIFRSNLFRPTRLQVLASRHAALGLFTLGFTLLPDHAFLPTIGFIIPAFRTVDLPVRIAGYTEVQAGPYLSWPGREGSARPSVAVLYDRRFRYFWGWYVKGLYVFGRKRAELPRAGSDFTITAGPSFWKPSLFSLDFFQYLHIRPGLRIDIQGFRPNFRRVGWDIQVEVRR